MRARDAKIGAVAAAATCAGFQSTACCNRMLFIVRYHPIARSVCKQGTPGIAAIASAAVGRLTKARLRLSYVVGTPRDTYVPLLVRPLTPWVGRRRGSYYILPRIARCYYMTRRPRNHESCDDRARRAEPAAGWSQPACSRRAGQPTSAKRAAQQSH